MSDIYRAMELLRLVGGDPSKVTAVVMPGAPYSKSRPRFSRNGRTYVKAADRAAEDMTAWRLRQAIDQPSTGNVAMVCIFIRPNRQRIDVDNMLKHVCDAANGIVWLDDSQCTALLGVAELDEDNPRTIVAFTNHTSTLSRGSDATKDCERCGRPFNIVGITKGRKFCSKECSNLARSGSWLVEPVPCAECGKSFKRITKTQKLCSPECRTAQIRGRNKGRGKPLSTCAECGKELAHTRGGRCRDCWRANPSGADPITTGERA